MFMRYFRTPKCLAGKFPVPSPTFHRMASFYNVDVAGLTDEQAEVRNRLWCGKRDANIKRASV